MMLVARIGPSDESNERVLELATRVVELQQIQLGLDDRAADFRAAVLLGRERERQPAALLVRLLDATDAVDARQHLGDLRLRIVAAGRAHRHRDLANLALHVAELRLGTGTEQRALTKHEQAITRLADLGEDVTRDQDRVVLLEVVDEVTHLDDLHRVETAGRLVEDEELRLVDNGLRDTDALPEAVRERSDVIGRDL